MWNVRLNVDNYTVCGEDPQYCPPGKRKFLNEFEHVQNE
jgi:hypothetical protein